MLKNASTFKSASKLKGDDSPAVEAVKDAPSSKPEDNASDKSKPRRRKKRSRKGELGAWVLSLLVHVVVLSSLAVATLHEEIKTKLVNLNSSMFKDTSGSEKELTKIYADQSSANREETIGQTADQAGTGGGQGGGNPAVALAGGGLGAPSATPKIGAVGKVGARGGSGAGNGSGLAGLKVVAQVSGLSLMPTTPGKDLGGGGGISGDVTFATGEIGEALDQLARNPAKPLRKQTRRRLALR